MALTISIGILAYNEEAGIRSTLESLLQQSLFQDPGNSHTIEIVVVPNGCRDNTATMAYNILKELASKTPNSFSWKVCEIEQPGKSNAWNFYVHEFSEPTADYLFLMDADIQFLNIQTLCSMVTSLETDPEMWVATDIPVKDVVVKRKKGLMAKLSVQASESSKYSHVAICGQLYCGRAHILRKVWMPTGLPVEDGFLRAVIATEYFTNTNPPERILVAPNASHMFEAYVKISDLLRHEKRLVIGTTINSYLFGYLWANSNPDQDAGFWIKHNNDQNPRWLHEFLQQSFKKQGWWLVPRSLLFRRFERLKTYSFLKAILRLPFTLLAFGVDLLVCIQANQEIHKTSGLGYWGKPQTSQKSA